MEVDFTWLGTGTMPQASLAGSQMHQKSPQLTVNDLIEANSMLKEIRDLAPTIRFIIPKVDSDEVSITTFSDASFNVSFSRSYVQTGFMTVIMFRITNVSDIYHIVDWSISKQILVCYSPFSAEILACTDPDD